MPFPVQLINVRKTDKCFITCYRTWRITWLIKAFDQESHRCFRPRARQYLKPPLTIKDLKTGSKNIFVINFENKGFDKIHVSSLFCCQDVISIAWAPQTNGNIPVHAMKLTRTIRIKVLNYRDAVQAMSLMTNAKMSFANKHLLLSL